MNWLVTPAPIAFVSAPWFVWIAAIVLLMGTAEEAIRLCIAVLREHRLHQALIKRFGDLLRQYPHEPDRGLVPTGFQALRKEFETRTALTAAWRNYYKEILLQRNSDGDDEYWSEESAEAAFTEAAVFGSRINREWFAAVPGWITSFGLLITFSAILVALSELRSDANTGQILGVSKLLEGLSGKFVSSVAALFAAFCFLPIEHRLFHSLEKSRYALINALDNLMPRLTPARILVRLQNDIAEQSNALRDFNTALAPKLGQSLSESMGPTLGRMVSAIDELNQLMRAAEAQKQDALTNSLTEVLHDLQRGMEETFQAIAEKFTESLSGGAGQQFDQVLASLKETATLVAKMNGQFETNQDALATLVTQARNSTAEQMELGKGQVQQLSAVLLELMNQLKEATGSSVSQMNGTLGHSLEQMTSAMRDSTERSTNLVNSLAAQVDSNNGASVAKMTIALNLMADQVSSKMNALGDQMAATLSRNTEDTNASAQKVITEATNWSRQSTENLAVLLERYQLHFEKVERLSGELNQVAEQFHTTLPQYSTVAKSFELIAAETNTAIQGSRDAANSIRESAQNLRNVHASITNVATASADQVTRLAEMTARIQQSMGPYEQTFARVNKEAGALFAQISNQLQAYTSTTRDGYEEMAKVANEHFTNAAQKLGNTVGELNESLDDLVEAFDRLKIKPNGRPSA